MISMSWIEKAVARENEILRMIELFGQSELRFILVGGYAVSAVGRHRFSVDCDIVVPKVSLLEFERVLAKEGYEKTVEKHGFDKVYGGEFASFVKKVEGFPVAVDLLVGSLACRQTGGVWSYSYIKKNSSRGVVAGIGKSIETVIPEKELLIALKIHSGRETDLRDIVMLSRDMDFDKVGKHIRKGERSKLDEQIKRELRLLADPRFEPSLKGVFTMRGDVSRDISRTREFLEKLARSEQRLAEWG